MEDQRSLDGDSFRSAQLAEQEMLAKLEILELAFSEQPELLKQIRDSQRSWQAYLKAHLNVVDAADAGSVASTIKNAEANLLYKQRQEILLTLLFDLKPDAMS